MQVEQGQGSQVDPTPPHQACQRASTFHHQASQDDPSHHHQDSQVDPTPAHQASQGDATPQHRASQSEPTPYHKMNLDDPRPHLVKVQIIIYISTTCNYSYKQVKQANPDESFFGDKSKFDHAVSRSTHPLQCLDNKTLIKVF